MEIFIFGRFHAREGCEQDVAAALLEVAAPTRVLGTMHGGAD